MIVRMIDSVVQEFVPEYTVPLEKWWPPEFVAQCVETDQESVEIGWVLGEDLLFVPPTQEPEQATTEQQLMQASVDHELRLTMLELGL